MLAHMLTPKRTVNEIKEGRFGEFLSLNLHFACFNEAMFEQFSVEIIGIFLSSIRILLAVPKNRILLELRPHKIASFRFLHNRPPKSSLKDTLHHQ
jgi:hypothetical protein